MVKGNEINICINKYVVSAERNKLRLKLTESRAM